MRESTDYTNLPSPYVSIQDGLGNENYSTVVGRWNNRPLPAEPITNISCNASYEYVETRSICSIEDKRRPPTPPPKPSRNHKYVPA